MKFIIKTARAMVNEFSERAARVSLSPEIARTVKMMVKDSCFIDAMNYRLIKTMRFHGSTTFVLL